MLDRLNDSNSDDNCSDIEWELPTRRSFVSLTHNDLFSQSFTSQETRKSSIKIDKSPLIIDEQGNDENENKPFLKRNDEIRHSMNESENNQIINKTIEKIFKEQRKMRVEIQKQFKQFNEYKEIENMEKEMQKKQEIKLKKEKELKQIQSKKEQERTQGLDKLKYEREMELGKIKEIISEEFSKRDNELLQKQQEIENLTENLKDKIKHQDQLNNELKLKSIENEQFINSLKNKVSELQNDQENLVKDDEIRENEKKLNETEHKIENVEMEQEEILKEINDNIEIQEHLENEQKELKQNEIELKEKQEILEIEKKNEIKKRSKNAYKKFDIERANIIMECEIEFEHIRKRKSLIDTDNMMDNIKLKMRKQFKEQMMRLRLQINDKIKNVLPYTIIGQFGEGDILFTSSPNNQMSACINIHGILHIGDINNIKCLYLRSLIKDDNVKYVKPIHIEWDKESVLLGVLLNDSKWIGIWNSITKQFYEFSVNDCNDIITSFAWSTNKLLLGMNNGDIHIKNMDKKETEIITIHKKMLDKIDICKLSLQACNNVGIFNRDQNKLICSINLISLYFAYNIPN